MFPCDRACWSFWLQSPTTTAMCGRRCWRSPTGRGTLQGLPLSCPSCPPCSCGAPSMMSVSALPCCPLMSLGPYNTTLTESPSSAQLPGCNVNVHDVAEQSGNFALCNQMSHWQWVLRVEVMLAFFCTLTCLSSRWSIIFLHVFLSALKLKSVCLVVSCLWQLPIKSHM